MGLVEKGLGMGKRGEGESSLGGKSRGEVVGQVIEE